jgi:hypothetical protein
MLGFPWSEPVEWLAAIAGPTVQTSSTIAVNVNVFQDFFRIIFLLLSIFFLDNISY